MRRQSGFLSRGWVPDGVWRVLVTLWMVGAVLAPGALGEGGEVSLEGEVAGGSGSFPTRILPLLTQAGCNAGACHGAATGQGGFALSLLGYDPEADHARITREWGGRRLDFDRPDESLLLRKASRRMPHEGGRRWAVDSEAYREVREWVASGAPYGPRDLRVVALEVEPEEAWLSGPGAGIDLRVTAHLSDGSRMEVTDRALHDSNDEAVAAVTRGGKVRATGSGLTGIMVRYGGQVAAARVGVRFEEPDGAALRRAAFASGHPVDGHLARTWERLGLAPAGLSDDATFLRRVHLDLIGRSPTEGEVRSFLGERGGAQRREAVIDRLLASEAWVDFWTMKLADLLQVGGRRGDASAAQAYHGWLREGVREGWGWDRMAGALIEAEGVLSEVGPANLFTLAADPRDLAEAVGRVFLGTQIACARCHAHPADRWTQDDYHAFAAYFARVEVSGGVVRERVRGEVDHPKTGRPVMPRPLGALGVDGGKTDPTDPTHGDPSRRGALAAWMTAPGNPFFARTLVNRVWRELFGRGLVEPVDDLRPTNPATHPGLLEELAREFESGGYDLRGLVRRLATSRAYQLESGGVDGDGVGSGLFTRALRKALPAAVRVDAVVQVTGVPEVYAGYAEGTRAVQLIDARVPSYALDVLGRCGRDGPCETGGGGTGGGGGLAQALHLLNGELINARVGVAAAAMRDGTMSAGEWVEGLYLRALTRYPREDERRRWTTWLEAAEDPGEAAEDLIWAMLNGREFGENR
ncbi:MAG: DUF1553 domain-containing protein [Verrucomicrobiae bacterium]|nr:DUF1553 domain-containing protein [Verrucomicrobiae bacterium]